jgi:hypothetical protein
LTSNYLYFSHLIGVLTEDNGFNAFREFLKGEYAVENLDFWKAVQDLKSCKNEEVLAKAIGIFCRSQRDRIGDSMATL